MSEKEARDAADLQTRSAQPLFLRQSAPTSRLPMPDQRPGREVFAAAADTGAKTPSASWDSLWSTTLDHTGLRRNGLFTDPTSSEIAGHFDVLRARLLLLIAANNWTRIAVTSPTPGCGKSFVAANLALSLARLPACRTLLIDLDLRAPRLAEIFGRNDVPALSGYLLGLESMESQVHRLGVNLAVALNGVPEARPYEILQDPETIHTLDALHARLQPDITIVDLPPALESDDVLAMAPHLDAVLMVVDGTATTPDDIRRCSTLLDGQIPFAGIVLNKSQDRGLARLRRARRNGGR